MLVPLLVVERDLVVPGILSTSEASQNFKVRPDKLLNISTLERWKASSKM